MFWCVCDRWLWYVDTGYVGCAHGCFVELLCQVCCGMSGGMCGLLVHEHLHSYVVLGVHLHLHLLLGVHGHVWEHVVLHVRGDLRGAVEYVWVCLGYWIIEDVVEFVAEECICASSVVLAGHALHEPW